MTQDKTLQLSNHDKEILTLLSQGKTPKELAKFLSIADISVYKVIERIRERNDIKNLNQLMYLFGKQFS